MAGTARSAELQEGLTPIVSDWFERVHGLPRTKIEYGAILAQTDEDYEVYNAHRTLTATISSIANGATPGITTPDVTPPHVLGVGSSTRDSTSTENSGVSGLGSFVDSKLRALVAGLPSFDAAVVFNTALNSFTLLTSGYRLDMFVPRFESPVVESLEFQTDVLRKNDGTEQRIRTRRHYRERLEVTYFLDGAERQRMQALLMGRMDAVIGVPMFHEEVGLSSAVGSGTFTYPVTGADDVDFRVGGFGLALTDAATFDVFTISAATDVLITAETASANAYAVNTPIIPLRLCRILGAVRGELFVNGLESFRLQLEAIDNATGALTGDTSAFSVYDTRVLLDDCNLLQGVSVQEEFAQKIHRMDNRTGLVTVASSWDRSKRTHPKSFRLHTRSDVKDVKRLLVALAGRQKALWIPTFSPDLTLVVDLAAASADIDITHIGYTDFIASRDPKAVVKISFTDGTGDIVRGVSSSVEVSSTVERLTLSSAVGVTKAVALIDRIEFYEPVRFDSDLFRITREGYGSATLRAPVKVVFDL
jgi:hypothetical protein